MNCEKRKNVPIKRSPDGLARRLRCETNTTIIDNDDRADDNDADNDDDSDGDDGDVSEKESLTISSFNHKFTTGFGKKKIEEKIQQLMNSKMNRIDEKESFIYHGFYYANFQAHDEEGSTLGAIGVCRLFSFFFF